MHWSTGTNYLVSASQDGKMLGWDALTTNKIFAIPLRTSWVMTCAYSPSNNYVASGGLDNICSVYNVTEQRQGPINVFQELNAHSGYISCCRFIDDKNMLTSSGDGTCILWDVNNHAKIREFTGHSRDVMSLSINPNDDNIFVTGACDMSAIVWDATSGEPVIIIDNAHDEDINAVHFLPNGYSFITGGDDFKVRLFDMRNGGEMMCYQIDDNCCVTSLTSSISARYIFAGYDDNFVRIFDTLKGNILFQEKAHENRVSCLGLNSKGQALCTGSWDCKLQIWA